MPAPVQEPAGSRWGPGLPPPGAARLPPGRVLPHRAAASAAAVCAAPVPAVRLHSWSGALL